MAPPVACMVLCRNEIPRRREGHLVATGPSDLPPRLATRTEAFRTAFPMIRHIATVLLVIVLATVGQAASHAERTPSAPIVRVHVGENDYPKTWEQRGTGSLFIVISPPVDEGRRHSLAIAGSFVSSTQGARPNRAYWTPTTFSTSLTWMVLNQAFTGFRLAPLTNTVKGQPQERP